MKINFAQTGILGALILTGCYIITKYLISYFERKAQNFADKKDIAQITEKVENIKSQYAMTLALLNTNLSLASKGIESFESETFKSYVAFHQACSYILNDLANIDFTTLNITNMDFLKGYNKAVMDSYKRLRIAKANHDLFNDNEEIRLKAIEFYKACVTYISEINLLLSKITFSIESVSDYNMKMLDYTINKLDNAELFNFFKKSYNENKTELERLTTAIKQFITGENFTTAIFFQSQYEVLIRKYVKDERKKVLNQ